MRGGYRAIDQFIGARIRQRRILLGLSQRDLAESIRLSTQQMVAKYELGKNAVSASLLYEIASALGESVDYFFDGIEKSAAAQQPAHQPLLLSLMRSLSDLKSDGQLDAINHLIRALATDPEQGKNRV